jgi:predicted Zn-dependent protease
MAKSSPEKKPAGKKKSASSSVKKGPAGKKAAGGSQFSADTKAKHQTQSAPAKARKDSQPAGRAGGATPGDPSSHRKKVLAVQPTPPPEQPPRLLRETKGTVAALALLEKGIKLIFWKDYRRARAELNSLIQSHPAEPEILARARSYLQICEREEKALHKPAVASDQIYTLGVIEHNRGNYDAAIALFSQSLAKNPESDFVYYALAASCALRGDAEQALGHLRKAIALNEANRVYAKNDADFISLHERGEFADLVGMTQHGRGEATLT